MVALESRKLLAAVYSLQVLGEAATSDSIDERLGWGSAQVRKEIRDLEKRRLLKRIGRGVTLTAAGRKKLRVVFIGGGFEVIHRGHLHTIERAKALGDVLVVSVARDSTIRKRKGREPVAGENERAALLSSLRQVDAAILGVEGDIYVTLEKVAPDIVALGYDQYHMEEDIESEGKRRGLRLKVVRLDSPFPGTKTSALLSET